MTAPSPTIAAVVEGHGEVRALPVLLRRIASELLGVHHLMVPPPFRVKRHRMTGANDLSDAAYVQAARITGGGGGGVLVVADADADCAIELASEFRAVVKSTPIEVCVAVREFEAWFLGAVESLRSHRAVRDDASYRGDPEAPRDAKGALAELMTEHYRETLHQPAFAAVMDLRPPQRVRSFAHLVTCVGRLVGGTGPRPRG